MAGTFVFGQLKPKLSQVFYTSKKGLSRGVVNLKPCVPGHILVIPVRPAVRFQELSAEEVSDLWSSAQEIGTVLEKHFQVGSLTFLMQDGADSGQTIRHVHVHIIPRATGDFVPNDDLYRQLETERTPRTEDEMETEAKALAQYWQIQGDAQ